MPQRTGDYRHRIVIQQRTDVLDAAGESRPSWSTFAVRWASRRVLSGAERFEGNTARQAELMAEFRTHMTRGVGTHMRLLYPGEVTGLTAAATSATTTSLTVASAVGFPQSGRYHVRIADELVLVTGGQGTTTWSVTRAKDGTTAATGYATGTKLQHVQVHDIESAYIDWQFGAETVMQARMTDGLA